MYGPGHKTWRARLPQGPGICLHHRAGQANLSKSRSHLHSSKSPLDEVCASSFNVRNLVLLEHDAWRKWQMLPGRREFGCPRYPLGKSPEKNNLGSCGLFILCRSEKKENLVGRPWSWNMRRLSALLGPTECGSGQSTCLLIQPEVPGFRRSPVSGAEGWTVKFSKTQEWAHLT